MHAVVSPPTGSAAAETTVMILLTIEAVSMTLVRQAILAACRGPVSFTDVRTVPRSTQVRVWLVLAGSAVTDAVRVILKTVPRGEIGPVVPQHSTQERRR
jgi:hypothetical protein